MKDILLLLNKTPHSSTDEVTVFLKVMTSTQVGMELSRGKIARWAYIITSFQQKE